MRTAPLLAALLACAACWPAAAQPRSIVATGERVEIAAQIRREQSLGRIVMDPAGRFLVYEWQRPYNWTPDGKGLSKVATNRQQTTLYRVLIPEDWRWIDAPTSEELFPMLPGATYWLGDLSPDGEWVSVYELDRDDKKMKAGVAATRHVIEVDKPPKIVWFDIAPDDARFDRPPAWTADGKSLVYPVKGGLARADAATGKATRCTDCTLPPPPAPAPLVEGKLDRTDVPDAARLAATSADGAVGAFVLDDASKLALFIRSMRAKMPKNSGLDGVTPGRTELLFDNERK